MLFPQRVMKNYLLRTIGLLAVALLINNVALSARKLILLPPWTPQAQFAGYYVADQLGYYKAKGIEIEFITSKSMIDRADRSVFLFNHKADMAIMNLSQALILRSKGVKIVNVLETCHRNSYCIVCSKPAKDLTALRNADLGTWNGLAPIMMTAINSKTGNTTRQVIVSGGINAFLSGALDFCLLCSFNELLQLKECGYNAKPEQILWLEKAGWDVPQDGIYVTEDFYNKNQKLVNDFVEASVKGWEYAYSHRKYAVSCVMKEVRKHKIATNEYHQNLVLDEVLRLQEANGSKQSFVLSKQEFTRSLNIVASFGGIGKDIYYIDFVKTPLKN